MDDKHTQIETKPDIIAPQNNTRFPHGDTGQQDTPHFPNIDSRGKNGQTVPSETKRKKKDCNMLRCWTCGRALHSHCIGKVSTRDCNLFVL